MSDGHTVWKQSVRGLALAGGGVVIVLAGGDSPWKG